MLWSRTCFNAPVSNPLLPIGSTVVRRDVFRDRVWTKGPVRVLASDETSAVTALWPGVVTLASTHFIESKLPGREALRSDSITALANGDYELGEWPWKWNSLVTEIMSERWFTVARMHGEDGALRCWYVNFERPPRWHASGWDTFDLLVDLVVEPDGTWRWKDEDEYAQGRRLGLVTDAEHAAVESARGQAVALVEARAGVFGADPTRRWLPDPAWPLPTLTEA